MKKILYFVGIIITCLTFFSCNLFYLPLGELADLMFTSVLSDDYYAWNIYTINSDEYGLEREDGDIPSWYSYNSLTRDDMNDAHSSFLLFRSMLYKIDYDSLTKTERITYNSLDDFLNYYCNFYDESNNLNPLLNLSYINSFGGYVSDFGSLVQSYHLRSEQDIKDLFSYIDSTKDAFSTYVTFVQDRKDAGYALSNYTLNSMIDYLDTILDKNETYYLFDLIENKINNCDFIDDLTQLSYISQGKTYLKQSFLVGCKELKEKLQDFVTSDEDDVSSEGYLGKYGEVGQKYYELSLEETLGFDDLDMEKYIAYLDNSLLRLAYRAYNVAANYQSDDNFWAYFDGTSNLTDLTDPDKMIEYLNDFAKTLVPTLNSSLDIQIDYMDDTVADITTTVAYYLKSALDNDGSEYITLNKNYLEDDYLETLSTLSHEGYPGHLYDYNYSKQLDISNFAKIMGCTGRVEGWAVYVQYMLYKYLGNEMNSDVAKAAGLYYAYNHIYSYLLYTRIDAGINYEGWSYKELTTYLTTNTSISDEDTITSLYRTLIEEPVVYASYGFGSMYILDLHEKAMTELGSSYNEIEFNTELLSYGEAGLEYLTLEISDYVIGKNSSSNGIKFDLV